jgi:hypothetical protein
MLATMAVTLALSIAVGALPADAAPLMERLAGPDVSYPLRHDFSMAIGLPGHADNEPTSGYDAWDHEGYLCRIVSGYEDTGDRRNFLVRSQDAFVDGYDERYGSTLVSRGGVQFEGCRMVARTGIGIATTPRADTSAGSTTTPAGPALSSRSSGSGESTPRDNSAAPPPSPDTGASTVGSLASWRTASTARWRDREPTLLLSKLA